MPALRLSRLLVLAAAIAVIVGTTAYGAPHRASAVCPSAGGGATAGSVKSVVRSKVYSGSKYVGAAPFALTAGSYLCTDSGGTVAFAVTAGGKSATCVMLGSSTVQVVPSKVPGPALVRFERGTVWCSTSAGTFNSATGGVTIVATGTTTFGVTTKEGIETVVKVSSGNAAVNRVKLRSPPRSQVTQITILATGGVKKGGPSAVVTTADDRTALAQLALAPR